MGGHDRTVGSVEAIISWLLTVNTESSREKKQKSLVREVIKRYLSFVSHAVLPVCASFSLIYGLFSFCLRETRGCYFEKQFLLDSLKTFWFFVGSVGGSRVS